MLSGAPVAVVAGGGGGIGRAIAKEFCQAGYQLALIDNDQTRLHDAQHELKGYHIVRAYLCDITSDADTRTVVSTIAKDLGRVDLLVHAAGLTQVSLARDTNIEVYRRVMDVNFLGVVRLTNAFLGMLIDARGQIIVLSSICGFAPLVGRTGYCASKYALHGYFETLRVELRRANVSVMLVCPSFVDTNFATRGLSGDGSVLSFDRSTLGKPLTPDHIARSILRAAKKRKRLLIFSWRGLLTYGLTRIFPAWYERLMGDAFCVELERSR
jgi:short-subunit dehydrogenase